MITDKERYWADVVLNFWRKHLRFPSQRELADAICVSRGMGAYVMSQLRKKGLIRQDSKKIVLVGSKQKITSSGVFLFWKVSDGKNSK